MSDYFISPEQAEKDLLSCAAFLAERIKSSDGHAEAMNAIIPRYLAKGDVDLAAELANAVNDPFSRDRLLILVAEKCAELGDDEYALQLAEAIEDHGLKAQTLERVALVMAVRGDTEKASEIADAMAHPDYIYAGIAAYQASNGDESAADVTLKQIEFPAARVSALHQIAAGQLEKAKAGDAVLTLDRAVGAADEIEHNEEKIRAFCDIGSLFIDAKRSDKAIETFDNARAHTELLDNMHRDLFLVRCALGFLYSGRADMCDRTLDLVTDKTQMASALVAIARDHWKKEEKDDAIDALDEAYEILKSQRDAETRDSRARNALMASIAVQFAGFGKTERGVEIALENQDIGEQMAALSQIAQILTVQKEDELARQTINSIGDNANRLFALIAVADAKQKIGESSDSLTLLTEAATLAAAVPQLSARSGALNEIAERYIDREMLEQARSLSLQNLAVIAEIRDESSRAASLANLSDIFAEANFKVNDAEKQHLARLVQKTEW
jgi:hypothetical protein